MLGEEIVHYLDVGGGGRSLNNPENSSSLQFPVRIRNRANSNKLSNKIIFKIEKLVYS